MATLPKFDTPARLRDMPAGSPFYDNWSNFIKARIDDIRNGDNSGGFYDPTATDVDVAGEKTLTWLGFPRRILLPSRRDDKPDALMRADSNTPGRRFEQDEYFEWYVHKNTAGKITKVTFVTEFRTYYQELWRVDRSAVVNIYRTLVNPAVVESDLQTPAGDYDVFNRWNTDDGIVHYIQSINTLSAAIGLSQGSVTSPLPNHNNYVAFPGFAGANTAVDPRVSYDVHMMVRKGLFVTFKDPIGIYITHWNNSGISKPDGSPAPASWWKVVRGTRAMALRLEYEVPSTESFVVGDLKLGGRPIEYGGQLAEEITVSITGTAGTRNRAL